MKLKSVAPKLAMRNMDVTRDYYVKNLEFEVVEEYNDYLMIRRDEVEIHFFLFPALDPAENLGQVYIRTADIDKGYKKIVKNGVKIHPNGKLELKPWGQKEFSLQDPDNNLVTFGEA